MKVIGYQELPWQLKDVVERIWSNRNVYGFELELLADFVS